MDGELDGSTKAGVYRKDWSVAPSQESVSLPPDSERELSEALSRPDLTHDEFYRILRNSFTEDNVKAHIDAMDLGVNPEEAISRLSSAAESGDYTPLLAEPHIVLRLDDFIDFINSQPKPLPTPDQLRLAYIADETRFPVESYYRAIISTDEEAQRVEEQGFPSKIASKDMAKRNARDPQFSTLDKHLFLNAMDSDGYNHLKVLGASESFFNSASIDPDASEAIVRFLQERDRPGSLRPGDKMQTFEIRSSSFYTLPIIGEEMGVAPEGEAYWEISKNGETKRIPLDPYPEKLLSLHIPPEKVRKMRSEDVSEAPSYKRVGEFKPID